MTVSYDPMLVMLSILIAIAGTLTGLAITAGYDRGGRRNYAASLIKGAVVIGGSIWSMHFVAMLAVQLPVLVSYNFVQTLFSLYIAITGTLFGLFITSRRRLGAMSVPVGGLMMGAAIGGMHYLGMDAMRGCGISYAIPGVIASVVIAVVASSIALWFTFRKRGAKETLAGGFMLGLAIPSMHYTAMLATQFSAVGGYASAIEPLVSQNTLALIITTATFVICGAFLFLFSSLAIGGGASSPRQG